MLKQTMPLLAAFAVAMSPVVPSSPAFAQGEPKSNQFWWPEKLDLNALRQHAAESDPMGEDFNYGDEFTSLDLDSLKRDIETLLTTSQDWWPADYGHSCRNRLLGRLVASEIGRPLDGHVALQAWVMGRVDDPHAAVAEFGRTEGSAWFERHESLRISRLYTVWGQGSGGYERSCRRTDPTTVKG